jgi:hypothetical protein
MIVNNGQKRSCQATIRDPAVRDGDSGLRVFGIKAYQTGYAGFLERENEYVFFSFSRRKKFKTIAVYEKSQYTSLNHFKSVMSKFVPAAMFLNQPIRIFEMTAEELGRVNGVRKSEKNRIKLKK